MQAPDTPCVKLAAVLQKQIEARAVINKRHASGRHKRQSKFRLRTPDHSAPDMISPNPTNAIRKQTKSQDDHEAAP
jgi:hypothetical protein